jgi:asparagine synthase (glutamine-hydrolysing)
MCGFVGYLSNQSFDLSKASEKIFHRGPDSQNITNGKKWSVAFNRLSIIDLSESAMQPFKHNKVTVYVNGEIYNYLELKQEFNDSYEFKTSSDCEVIPLLYEKYGIDFVNKINGFFSIVIIDELKDKFFLIRDRYGKKPLYFHKCLDSIFFGSEIKAIKEITDLKVNNAAIASNLYSWFLLGNQSLYKDVFNVNPGSYLEINHNFSIKEYKWYLPKINKINYSYDEIEKNYKYLFDESIKLRLRSDVDVGIFLSGGLDSMSINHSLEKHSKKTIHKFVAKIEGKESIEKNTTDTQILNRYLDEQKSNISISTINADYYNKNIVKIASNYERLFVNSGVLIFYALSEQAKLNNVKVIMTGAGGDEIFGGYSWQKPPNYIPDFLFNLLINSKNSNNFDFITKSFGSGISNKIISLNLLYRFTFQTKSWHAQSLSPYFQGIVNNNNAKKMISNISEEYFNHSFEIGKNDIHNKVNFSNIFTTINSQLYDADMGTMNNSIENRAPYLDHNLFEFMLSVPTKSKYMNSQKILQRKLMKNSLPDYVVNAPKSGPTMPVNLWFNSLNKNNSINNFIKKNNYLVAELLSESLYSEIKNDRHFIYKHNSLPAFAIISFILWAKINVENSIKDYSTPLLEI